ncbi:MAG: hypothetical protein V4560_11415 [Bacteroidota bacterium]
MHKSKNKYHQNRSGLALGLLILFVVLTALCPVKRIFFSSVSTPLVHQKAKVTFEKQSPKMQQFKTVATGLCGLSYVTFKKTIIHKPSVNVDLVALASLTLIILLLFKASSLRVESVPVSANYQFTTSTPLFIRNQLLLI